MGNVITRGFAVAIVAAAAIALGAGTAAAAPDVPQYRSNTFTGWGGSVNEQPAIDMAIGMAAVQANGSGYDEATECSIASQTVTPNVSPPWVWYNASVQLFCEQA